MQYYFVVPSLPTLKIGMKPEMTFNEFRSFLSINLSDSDYEKLNRLVLPLDISNIRALWKALPLDGRGNLNPKELEEAILVKEGLPEFVIEYLDRYDSVSDRLRYFASLYASMYRELESKEESDFLLKYFSLERQIRIWMTGLRAKQFNKDLIREFQFEDPTDPSIMEILSQQDAAELTLPSELEELKAISLETKPKEQHLAYLNYRFKKIEELIENEPFSMDRILGFMALLLIVESWEGVKEGHETSIMEKIG